MRKAGGRYWTLKSTISTVLVLGMAYSYTGPASLDDKPSASALNKRQPEKAAAAANTSGPNSSARQSGTKAPAAVKGIYVSGWTAGSGRAMERLIRLTEQTELNAMVIDVKNEYGELTYPSRLNKVNQLGADRRPPIRYLKPLLARLHRNHIYTIGRVVVFKDPLLAQRQPQWALHRKSGGIWRDNKGKAWVNPFRKEVLDYNIAVAAEAAKHGFDEIQFDYVRFPANTPEAEASIDYGYSGFSSKAGAIRNFLHLAKSRLHQQGTKLSVDVFGLVTSAENDMGIGQTWKEVACQADYISPMTYPSHYSQGVYGIPNPDLSPYATIRSAMTDAVGRNRQLGCNRGQPAGIRPWLQSFTATWIHPHLVYGRREVLLQIKAAHDAGVEEYLLWNPRCVYPLMEDKRWENGPNGALSARPPNLDSP
ncbi:putative glycoside hydrolase [Paenibacillus beijingensis]|uniref:putative glycoside hydrolase n=1 Tax=Paenibacillus beijingensis TaxID=1126833 RepID=UPI0006988A70|nr:putative glycoside hydrolase [Paenibacillus beijingensis]